MNKEKYVFAQLVERLNNDGEIVHAGSFSKTTKKNKGITKVRS